MQRVEVIGTEIDRAAELHRESRQPFAVPVRVGVAGFDGHGQRDKCGFGGIERVDQLLDPRKRPDAGAQLVGMYWLRQVLVCSGFDTADTIGEFCLTRDEHNWRESRFGVSLQLAADLEAVDKRHRDIEEDDVRSVPVNSSQRGCAIGSEDDVVAVGAEQTMKQRTDAFPVVGNQHAAPAQFRN